MTFRKGAIMRTKLTPAFVQKARAEPGAECTLFWDMNMPGFGLAVTAARGPAPGRCRPGGVSR